jgi:hypothetical protein
MSMTLHRKLFFCGCLLILSNTNNLLGMNLIRAVQGGQRSEVQRLLDDPRIDPNVRDESGNTALIYAVNNDDVFLVERLLADERTDPNIKTPSGYPVLLKAVLEGYENIVELLLANKRTNPNIVDGLVGRTALMAAAFGGHEGVVEKLLASKKTDPNIFDMHGNTALAYAAMSGHERVVDLLLGVRGSLKIPEKSCFLTFEQNDGNGSIAQGMLNTLLYNVVVMSSACLFKNLIDKYPFTKKYFISGKWSLFLNKSRDFGVIIPESLKDIRNVHDKYGLKDLDYTTADKVLQTLQGLRVGSAHDQSSQLIEHFKEIIDTNSFQHPTRFNMYGHGEVGGLIAGIPFKQLEKLFVAFADIDTEFLYLTTCYAAGSNLLEIQSALQGIVEKQFKEHMQKQIDYERFQRKEMEYVPSAETYRSPDLHAELIEPELPQRAKGNNYIIVLRATSDVQTFGFGDWNTLFRRLNKYNIKQISPKELAFILDTMPKHSQVLASVRWPGTDTFFRAVNLGDMEIITMNRLQGWRLEKLLSSKALARDVYQLQKELGEVIKREPLLKMQEAVEKEKRLSASIKKAEAKLKKALQIEIPIKENTKYIQIFPSDLSDCTFKINGSVIPKFISKIPGQAHHFIGKIQFESPQKSFSEALTDLLNNGFVNVFKAHVATTKCWFIKSLELTVAGKMMNIRQLAIYINPEAIDVEDAQYGSFAFVNQRGDYIILPGPRAKIDQKYFEDILHEIFMATVPSYTALFEVTGGHEVSYSPEEKAQFEAERGRKLKETTVEHAFKRFLSKSR